MSDSKKGILKLVKGKWVRETPPPDSRSAEEIIAANLAKLEAQRVEASRKAQEERAKRAENEKKTKASEETASASCAVMGGKRKTRRSSRKNRKQTRRSPRKNRKQTRRS